MRSMFETAFAPGERRQKGEGARSACARPVDRAWTVSGRAPLGVDPWTRCSDTSMRHWRIQFQRLLRGERRPRVLRTTAGPGDEAADAANRLNRKLEVHGVSTRPAADVSARNGLAEVPDQGHPDPVAVRERPWSADGSRSKLVAVARRSCVPVAVCPRVRSEAGEGNGYGRPGRRGRHRRLARRARHVGWVLVTDGDDVTLVDTGYPGDRDRVIASLARSVMNLLMSPPSC